MPHRRLTALLVLVATTIAGCTVEVSPDVLPVPFSVAPTPSASAGVPKYVCTAAYKILTDGAVHLAGFMTGSGTTGLRDTLTDMAAQFDAEAARTTAPELRQALGAVSDDLNSGANQPDPKAYVNGGFQTVSQKLDDACADA